MLFPVVGTLASAQAPSSVADGPFQWRREGDARELRIVVDIPAKHYLYDEATTVAVTDAAGLAVTPTERPRPVVHEFEGMSESILPEGVAAWRFPLAGTTAPHAVKIEFQGCRKEPYTCFMPGTVEWKIGAESSASEAAAGDGVVAAYGSIPSAATTSDWRDAAGGFRVGGTLPGYAPAESFLAFLDAAVHGRATDPGLFGNLRKRNMLMALALVLIGGLALNLTPCVLPMIPINLAIIGAGSQGRSRRHGFFLGGAYGFGIMAVYGLLGVAAVLTGATFGALNASSWFNLAIALVFAVLALAMFDILAIDFSRYQRGGPAGGGARGRYGVALAMGGVSALLAGACVAPVVIAVLLYATALYVGGNPLGLLLPFVLGLGMALPWPLAGAGMGLLPRPGAWMVRVKHLFGVFILAAAAYYAWQAYVLSPLGARSAPTETAVADGGVPWRSDLAAALAEAAAEGRPVFIDFWASWCKNCQAMDRTTFRDPAVQDRLREVVPVKFRAENPADPATKAVLDHFGVLGLPTFVVLLPHPPPVAWPSPAMFRWPASSSSPKHGLEARATPP
jgi:thiol:disulfide interchange protein